MAQIPNWSVKSPITTDDILYHPTGTPSNPFSGYYTTSHQYIGDAIIDSGFRNYRKTPNYFKLPPLNYLAPLGYEADFQQKSIEGRLRVVYYDQSIVAGTYTLAVDTTSTTQNLQQLSPISDPTQDSVLKQRMLDKAIHKLLDRLKDSSVNVAQAFAEREETVRTVTSTVRTVASVLTNLHKGNFAGAAKALGIKPPKRGQRRFNKNFVNDASNAISDGWLSLQYGWKPLLQDVYGSAQQLAKSNLRGENGNTIFAVASGKGFRKWKQNRMVIGVLPPKATGYDAQLYSMEASLATLYKCRYTRSSPLVQDLSSLGITNPVSLAWELVPYSFVVDWFLPIGDWLSDLDATKGLSFQSGFHSMLTKYQATATWGQFYTYTDRPGSYTDRSYDSKFKHDTMDRTRLSAFPQAPMPHFKNPISFSHMISAFALLKQFKR